MKPLPIHERFNTFQGEGVHMGRPAFFIRTFGCPLKCPWCDSAGTWHPNYVPKTIERFDAETLFQEACQTDAQFVVVTGGEPAIHDLRDLTFVFTRGYGPGPGLTPKSTRRFKMHLETSGAFPILGEFDWITLSPKDSMPPLCENVRKANELKLIIEQPSDIVRWLENLFANDPHWAPTIPIWLHPEWSKRDDPEVLSAITQAVKGERFPLTIRGVRLDIRAGWQLHKLYRSDALDGRSAQPVPLGGNTSKGY